MSKASQRRLAEQQKRDKQRISKLPQFPQLLALLFETIRTGASSQDRWRLLSAKITPDAHHPDKAELVARLRSIAHSFLHVDTAIRDHISSHAEQTGLMTSCTIFYGGRLHVDLESGQSLSEWLDPAENLTNDRDIQFMGGQVTEILRRRMESLSTTHGPIKSLAWSFMAPIGEFPVCYFGLTPGGAHAALLSSPDGMFVANSSALGELAFAAATALYRVPGSPPSANAMTLQTLAALLKESSDEALLDPTSEPRQYLAEIISMAVIPQVEIELAMAESVDWLEGEIAMLEDVADGAAAAMQRKLKTAEAEVAKARRKKAQEPPMTRKIAISPLQAPSAVENTPRQHKGPPEKPKEIALAQRMGRFFGQG
jgi:hypothetical protein